MSLTEMKWAVVENDNSPVNLLMALRNDPDPMISFRARWILDERGILSRKADSYYERKGSK